MRKMLCIALSSSILLVLLFTLPAAPQLPGVTSAVITDQEAAGILGGGPWKDFFSGVACGLGFTLVVSGYASGVGAPVAAALTASTLAACATALGL